MYFTKKSYQNYWGLSYRDHTSKTFQTLNCLNLLDIIKFKTCLHTYKAERELLPVKLSKRYTRTSKIHNYNTRHCEDLYKIAYKANSKKYCLSVEGVRVYNNLSYDVRNIKSENCFKNRLKRLLLESYCDVSDNVY